MPKKNLLFDFNGVISYNNFWQDIYDDSHALYTKRTQLNDYLFKDNFQIVKDWMIGKYTAEEIHHIIEEGLGIQSNYLFPIFKKGAEEIDISTEILSKLQKLRSEYNLILITDNMDSFPRFTRPTNPILDQTFDRVYDSHTTKLLKKDNDGEIFMRISKDFDTDISESFLFDDSLSNCQLFANLGGNSINVTGISNVLNQMDTFFN